MVLIRFVARSDLQDWQSLFAGYNAFYDRVGGTALATQIVDTTWDRLFDPAEPVHALVAQADAALVGFAHFLYHRSTTAVAPVCYLQDLFTIADMRGRGVGRALVEAVYDAARHAGAGRVYWQTHESNRTAMRLYDTIAEKPGFVLYRKTLA